MHSAQSFVTFPMGPQSCLQILKNTSSHFWHGLMISFKENGTELVGLCLM